MRNFMMLMVCLGVTTTALRAEEPAAKVDAAALEKEFKAIVADYETNLTAAQKAVEKIEKASEFSKIWFKIAPNEYEYCESLLKIAERAPKSQVGRDAAIKVVDKPNMGEEGPYGDQFARGVKLLVRHHGNDPRVAKIGLSLVHQFSANREAFLLGIHAAATDRETKGYARLALAKYFQRIPGWIEGARKNTGRDEVRWEEPGDDGKSILRVRKLTPEQKASQQRLRFMDPEYIRKQVTDLYNEVIRDYGDVVFQRRGMDELEAALKMPKPAVDGKELTADEIARVRKMLARKQTLGDVAKAALDEMNTIVVGKPAPAFEGKDLDGKPLKLSDYKGKVIALVFWGSWCGPCMAEVPREREIVAALKGRPFVMLGVNANETAEEAKKAVEANRMSWPQLIDGDDGPIVAAYHVNSFPTIILVDHKGILRSLAARGPEFQKSIEKLIAEIP